jgi:hypothetical protein
MKISISPLVVLVSSLLGTVSNATVLTCRVTEFFSVNGQAGQTSTYPLRSTDPSHGFTDASTTGFYAPIRSGGNLYLSAITQRVDGKDWIQVAFYRDGQPVTEGAANTELMIGMAHIHATCSVEN